MAWNYNGIWEQRGSCQYISFKGGRKRTCERKKKRVRASVFEEKSNRVTERNGNRKVWAPHAGSKNGFPYQLSRSKPAEPPLYNASLPPIGRHWNYHHHHHHPHDSTTHHPGGSNRPSNSADAPQISSLTYFNRTSINWSLSNHLLTPSPLYRFILAFRLGKCNPWAWLAQIRVLKIINTLTKHPSDPKMQRWKWRV